MIAFNPLSDHLSLVWSPGGLRCAIGFPRRTTRCRWLGTRSSPPDHTTINLLIDDPRAGLALPLWWCDSARDWRFHAM